MSLARSQIGNRFESNSYANRYANRQILEQTTNTWQILEPAPPTGPCPDNPYDVRPNRRPAMRPTPGRGRARAGDGAGPRSTAAAAMRNDTAAAPPALGLAALRPGRASRPISGPSGPQAAAGAHKRSPPRGGRAFVGQTDTRDGGVTWTAFRADYGAAMGWCSQGGRNRSKSRLFYFAQHPKLNLRFHPTIFLLLCVSSVHTNMA